MKRIIFILTFFLAFSCNKQAKLKNAVILESVDAAKNDALTSKIHPDSKNKVKLDFLANKVLLDIILLLPDSAFSSWGWKLDNRKKWYNEIKSNNFYIDNNPNYFTLNYFNPTGASFSIVDGTWKISIYKTTENSFIVITDDIVGDGNSLSFYEVKSDKIRAHLNEKLLFNDHIELLKQKSGTENCDEIYRELENPIFTFDFSNNNKIEIESSWYLTKDEYKNCLLGNAVTYNFNPKTKKFDVGKVYWKSKQKA